MNYSAFEASNQDALQNNSKPTYVQVDFTVAIVFSVFDCIGITFGALANIGMIILVLTQSGLQSTTDIFTSSLCVSDLLASVLFQPFVIRRMLARQPNPKYEWALRRFVGQTTLSASTMSLITATADRYIVLRWPLRHVNLVPKKAALSVVAMLWIVSLAMGVMAYLKRELAAFIFPAFIVVVVATIVIFQILIFFIARNQAKRISSIEQRPQKRYFAHMKATKTMALLLAVFLLSWLPSTIFRFYDRFTGGNIKTFHKWLHVLNTLIQIHCSLDPYLYVFRNRRFRAAIARFFRRRDGC